MRGKKKILLIICGGIAAYKSLDLIKIALRKKYEVKTILTKSEKKFITPLSLTTLTKDKPYQNLFVRMIIQKLIIYHYQDGLI